MMLSNHLILYRALLLLPSIFASIRVFSNESALCIRWPKYWSFSFSISPSNEYSGLISSRIDWFDLLAILGAQALMLFQGICPETPHSTPATGKAEANPATDRRGEDGAQRGGRAPAHATGLCRHHQGPPRQLRHSGW